MESREIYYKDMIGVNEEIKNYTPVVKTATELNINNKVEVDRKYNTFKDFRYEDQDFRLSEKQEFVVRRWMETNNMALVRTELNKAYGKPLSVSTIKRWLESPTAKLYKKKLLEEKVNLNDWTYEYWFKQMTDRLNGKVEEKTSSDGFLLKQIGEALGYYEKSKNNGSMTNVQIVFTQSNGVK